MKRYAIALVFPALFGVPHAALAFCNNFEILDIDVHCDDIGHQAITGYIDFLSPAVYADIEDELAEQDTGAAEHSPAIHFDSCRFEEGSEYINGQYDLVIEALNPAAPTSFRQRIVSASSYTQYRTSTRIPTTTTCMVLPAQPLLPQRWTCSLIARWDRSALSIP